MAPSACLIVGLGNPGLVYAATRHNLGFMVVRALAKKLGFSLSREKKWKAKYAGGKRDERPLHLLLPLTYMNLSGLSVKKATRALKLSEQDLLVVVDDAALQFGALRLRPEGSAGGHNGLKSVEEQLESQSYPRLRMGVGPHEGENLEEYVLSKFSPQEKRLLPEFIERGIEVIEAWLDRGTEAAMQLAGDLSKRPLDMR